MTVDPESNVFLRGSHQIWHKVDAFSISGDIGRVPCDIIVFFAVTCMPNEITFRQLEIKRLKRWAGHISLALGYEIEM